MRRRIGLTAVAAAALAAAVLWVARPGGAQVVSPRGKALRVAVVDIRQVSATCKQSLDSQAALEREREAKLKAVDSLREKLKKAKADLEVLRQGSRAWQEQNGKVLRLEVEARVLADLSVKELQAQNLDLTTEIYEAIIKAIDEFAKAKSIDVVFRKDASEINSKSMQELMQKTALRNVLYAAPALDITEDVRRAVDRAYETEKTRRP